MAISVPFRNSFVGANPATQSAMLSKEGTTLFPVAGLISYSKLDGNSIDSVDIYLNGVDTSITYGAGKIGNAAIFNGTTSYIAKNDSTQFSFGAGGFAVSAWVKRSVIGASHLICGQNNSGGVTLNISIQIEITATNIIKGFMASGSTLYIAQSTATVDTAWHHIVFTRTADNTLKLYLDNVEVATFTGATGAVNDSPNKFSIGRTGDYDGQYFNGSIDEVGVWNTTLTVTQVGHLYNSGNGLTYPV